MKNFKTIAGALLLMLTFLSFGKANAYVIPDGYYYIVSEVFDSKNPAVHAMDNASSVVKNGNNIRLWEWNATKAQIWRVENKNGGIIIHSGNNDNYVVDNYGSRTVNCNNINLWEKNGSNAQLWFPEKVGEGVYVIRSANNPDYVIDLYNSGVFNGSNIQLYKYNGSDAQKWFFRKVN